MKKTCPRCRNPLEPASAKRLSMYRYACPHCGAVLRYITEDYFIATGVGQAVAAPFCLGAILAGADPAIAFFVCIVGGGMVGMYLASRMGVWSIVR